MRKTVLGALVAVMLFAGAAVAVAQTDDSTTTTEGTWQRPDRGQMLEDVLGGLVADDTLTQEQADAVIAALEAARAERVAARQEMRAAMQEAWSDGVLTEDELSVLPNGGSRLTDPDGPLAEYWADGRLTQEELDEARANGGLGFGRGGRHGQGLGPDA